MDVATNFVDIHTHILPGVDDGAKSLEVSLDMARLFVEHGTTSLFATSHGFAPSLHVDAEDILRETFRLNDALIDAQIPLTVRPAMEIRYHSDIVRKVLQGLALGLGGAEKPNYILIELPTRDWPEDVWEAIYEFAIRDITVVIAHPERNLAAQRDEELLDRAIEEGAILQLTAGSIMGQFGPICENLSKRWLMSHKIHCIASDAHDPVVRAPGIDLALKKVTEQWQMPEQAAQCVRTAQRIWDSYK